MRTIGALLYPNFEVLDLYGPLEMFGSLANEFNIATVAEEAGPVTSAQGPATLAEHTFDSAPALDMILVPGGIGTVAELDNERLLGFLTQRSPAAELVMSVCSGSALLAKAGLLDNKRATSNKMFFDLARNQSTATTWVEEARWVIDGKFATSSGVSAGTDMALAVIEQLLGQDAAEQVAAYTEYQRHQDPDTDPFVSYLNQGQLPTTP